MPLCRAVPGAQHAMAEPERGHGAARPQMPDNASAPPVPEDPDARIRARAPAHSKGVVVIEHEGRRLVAKFPEPKGRSWPRALAARQAAAAMASRRLPLAPFRLPGREARLSLEAERLTTLAEDRIPVPELVGVTDQYLLMTAGGESLEKVLKRLPPDSEDAGRYVARAARVLGDMHRRGHWHGAAQVRNVLVDEHGRITLIDFEEDLSEVPAETRACYDLMLFLASIALGSGSAARQGPRITLGQRALQAYEAATDPDLLAPLERYHRRLRRLQRLARPIETWTGRKVRRTLALADILDAASYTPS